MKLRLPWTLGGIELPNRLVLAPLAGIGNWFVRLQAKRYGAGLAVSEMVSSFGLAYGDKRTMREFLRIHPDEHPVSIQLFGHDPAIMREAAAIVADAGADLIDLNMGCPVRKVCKTGAGASLLGDHPEGGGARASRSRGWRAARDRQAALRPGARRAHAEPSWRAGSWTTPAWPASASIRGTPPSSTPGRPDYALARELVESLPVPVILSGGLSSEESTVTAFEESGAAAVMLARGSLGQPWRFARLLGRYQGEPSPAEVADELEWVIERAEEHLGVDRAGRYLRKFYPWYADTLGLTRREREPLVSAPTTADARVALRALVQETAELAA